MPLLMARHVSSGWLGAASELRVLCKWPGVWPCGAVAPQHRLAASLPGHKTEGGDEPALCKGSGVSRNRSFPLGRGWPPAAGLLACTLSLTRPHWLPEACWSLSDPGARLSTEKIAAAGMAMLLLATESVTLVATGSALFWLTAAVIAVCIIGGVTYYCVQKLKLNKNK